MQEGKKNPEILTEKEGALGWITFNRPQLHNAITYQMWQDLPLLLDDFAHDENVRIIILRGAGGRAFVSGADISQFEEKRSTEESAAIYNRATDRATGLLTDYPKPTIAMIDGYCIGGGCSIAISCDFRIATTKSTFAIPAAKLGLGYSYPGVEKLVNLIGPSHTKEIFYTARQFSAREALAMGLINRVVAEDEVEDYVRQFALSIAANAPLTIKAIKAAVGEALKEPAEKNPELVERLVADCFASQDYQEGRRAFLEKREPHFKNK